MSRIIFDSSLMQRISLFESLTHAKVKDAISEEELLLFIVEPGEVGKAIGKGGRNIKQLEKSFKKRVQVVEFNEDPLHFLENLVQPASIAESKMEDSIILVKAADSQSRGSIIGRGGANLRFLERIMSRYFEIKEIKVE